MIIILHDNSNNNIKNMPIPADSSYLLKHVLCLYLCFALLVRFALLFGFCFWRFSFDVAFLFRLVAFCLFLCFSICLFLFFFFWYVLLCADLCWFVLIYADLCWFTSPLMCRSRCKCSACSARSFVGAFLLLVAFTALIYADLNAELCWFMLIHACLCWFVLIYADLCWFMLITSPLMCRSRLYMLVMFCAILFVGAFLLLVTLTALPVSTTHAIVGAVVGMTAVGVGWDCLEWKVSENQIKSLTLPRILVPGVVSQFEGCSRLPSSRLGSSWLECRKVSEKYWAASSREYSCSLASDWSLSTWEL
jgi:hypothetical protein